MAHSFKTSPIPMAFEEYYALIAHLEQFRVHPTGFRNQDGSTMYDDDREEPIDGNRVCGEPILMDLDEETGTVVFQGNGTFELARIETNYGYSTMSPVVGNFLDDILSEQFIENHKGISVIVESELNGEKLTEIINLDLYHRQIREKSMQ